MVSEELGKLRMERDVDAYEVRIATAESKAAADAGAKLLRAVR